MWRSAGWPRSRRWPRWSPGPPRRRRSGRTRRRGSGSPPRSTWPSWTRSPAPPAEPPGSVAGLLALRLVLAADRGAGHRGQHLPHVLQLGLDAVAAAHQRAELALHLGLLPAGLGGRVGDHRLGLPPRRLEDLRGPPLALGPVRLGLPLDLLGRLVGLGQPALHLGQPGGQLLLGLVPAP